MLSIPHRLLTGVWARTFGRSDYVVLPTRFVNAGTSDSEEMLLKEPDADYVSPHKARRSRRVLLCVLLILLAPLIISAVLLTLRAFPRVHQSNLLPSNDSHLFSAPMDSLLALSVANNTAAPSVRWAPATISECKQNTPQYFAPCAASRTPGAVYGEELIYPDFRLRQPIFAPSRAANDTAAWWRLVDGIAERGARCDKEWVCYRGQTGQNIVVGNATYTGNPPPDSWSDQACMSDGASLAGLEVAPSDSSLSTDEYAAAYPIDVLHIATSPDSWSFQHFLDRITHIVSQGAHLSRGRNSTEVVTGRAGSDVVTEMWNMLGFTGQHVHHAVGSDIRLAAKTLVFSCRAPLVHPWLSLRTLETFGLDPHGVPLAERKKVVYMSRSHGGAGNGGRRVLNEDEMLDDIRELLSQRKQREELVLFHELQQEPGMTSEHALMAWFHANARAVIGPHGGALFNHRWAGADALVLEMIPQSFTSLMFWEEASALGQVYASMILPPSTQGSTDMRADRSAVLEILHEHLGVPDARGASVEGTYQWHAPELMAAQE